MCLVGNKSDLEESRQVNVKDAQEYADSIGALFHETSALKNIGKDIQDWECLPQGMVSDEIHIDEVWIEEFYNLRFLPSVLND